MELFRNAISVAALLLIGIVLGLVVIPADGKALEQSKFAGPSRMGDPDCARIARQAGHAFLTTAFKYYDLKTARVRYCDLSAASTSRAPLSPWVSYGQARARFAGQRQSPY